MQTLTLPPEMQPDDEIYPKAKNDRRLAPNIPGRGGSRRGSHQRYSAELLVSVYDPSEESEPVRCLSEDVSFSGMLLHWPEETPTPAVGDKIMLHFTMSPGILPEGYESRVRIPADVVRLIDGGDGEKKVAVNFVRDLGNYLRRKKWLRLVVTSVLLLAISVYAVAYMRQESVFYFMFDVPVFTYGIIASIFLVSRFAFAFFDGFI